MRANLEKQQWFLEQLEINRIAFDGEWFYNTATGHRYKSQNSRGYVQINLLRPEPRAIMQISHHLLIWIMTYGVNDDDGLVINHKDGNKLNNKIENLELVSVGRNNRHARENGMVYIQKGEEKVNAIFTDAQVVELRSLYRQGKITQTEISKKFGCQKQTAFQMVHRITYKHLP
jgi:hypothetical protein